MAVAMQYCGPVHDVTESLAEVEVVAPDDVREYVAAHGGRVFVWVRPPRGLFFTPCTARDDAGASAQARLRVPSPAGAGVRDLPGGDAEALAADAGVRAPPARPRRGVLERDGLDRLTAARAAADGRAWHTPASVDVRTKAAGPGARTIATALTALAVLLVLLAPAASAAAAAAAPQRSVTLAEPVYRGELTRDVLTQGEDALVDGGRAALGAPRPGSGGWYWPIGTEDFQGWSGWLDRRGSYLHVAQDMPCPAGRAVYAIGAGTVFISRADAGGYGVGGAPGGCIIITHVTAAGTKFHALYGHVSGLKVKEGQRVAAGQLIAQVNGCRHLHFSTHPGAKYRDGNPYAGHVPRSWADHGGFVDPVRFLKTNPRAAAYKPPALPVVEIATQTAPFGYGAVDGAAYWSEEGAAGSTTWRLDARHRRARHARRRRGGAGVRR